jgi:hypothetical protein
MAKSTRKINVKDISFYTDKIDDCFLRLAAIDVFAIIDLPARHSSIKIQMSIMEGLVTTLLLINTNLRRDKKGYYPQLHSFVRYINYFKKYISEYPIEKIESDIHKQAEINMQLDMMTKISKFEDFVDLQSEYIPVTDGVEIAKAAGGRFLSLMDLKLIGVLVRDET